MIEGAALICILVSAWLLLCDARERSPAQMVLSPFWYFTFLFIVAFPIRAYLINAELITIQALPKHHIGKVYEEPLLTLVLLFSLALWMAVLYGRNQTLPSHECLPSASPPPQKLQSSHQILTALSVSAIIAIVAIVMIGDKSLKDFDGANYQASRMGSGLLWTLPEFFFYTAIAYIGWLIKRWQEELRPIDLVILAAIAALSFWISSTLFSRRLIAGIILALLMLATVRHRKLWPLMLASIIGTVAASGVLDFSRQLYFLLSGDLKHHTFFSLANEVLVQKPIFLISASFEGADHLARLFEKASWLQLLTGIDHGISLLFNAGGSLIPRAIWTSKPLIYGGMEQMHWLYPGLFKGDFATAGIPMSLPVDFSFAFGLPFALVMAFVFGRLLGTAERLFWDRTSHPSQVALSLFIFIYMFNWVRGGTIIVQSVMLFSIPAALMFGLRPVLHAAFGLAGEAVGLVGGQWWGTTRIYFFPHSYLRDRQLDTIRNWPTNEVIKADIATQRIGAQVNQDQALKPSRPSWKTILPLINLKRRPKDAPKDAAVYVWGGLIAKGPFITDIDNPYAFTGYNTFAVKLYRPIIQSFLESPRCLEIRCLSQACLEGVRREYGEAAAAKAVVAYPKITAKLTNPRTQSADTCRFLFVSTQFEIKGGAALLSAFKRVVREFPGAELDLVTHLPDGADVNIPHVHVHPANLTRDEISEQFLSTADVLVHPTYFDSFGMVVLEAIAHGLPVIATDVYAIKEMVEDNINGLLLEAPLSIWSGTRPTPLFSDTTKVRDLARVTDTSKFEDALTEAMLKMARDPQFRAQASTASLHLVRTKFSRTP